MKRVISIYAIFILNIVCFCNAEASEADSIRRILPTLVGKERIVALSNLCRLARAQSDPKVELAAIRDYIKEAHKQEDFESEGSARSTHILCFYNYDMTDSIDYYLPQHLKIMAKHGLWNYYYNSWNAKIEQDIYLSKIQTALRGAQKMYKDAYSRGNNYGLGISSLILGNIYHAQQRHAMAEKALNESINRLSKEDDVSFLLEGYNNLCEVFDASGNYPRLKIIANKWKNSIDAYKKKAEAKGYTPALGGRYLKCYVYLGIVSFETGEMNEASKYLSLAEEMAEGRSAMSKYKLRQAQSRFLEKQGKYSEALACADENYHTLISSGDSVSVLPVLESRARLTLLMGNPNKSVELYRQLMMMKDRLRDGELARQTDELNNIYKVDQYRLENEKYQLQLLFLVGGCLLLLILLGILYYHNRTIKRKNIALITRLRIQERLEQRVKSIESARPLDTLNTDEQIFRQIEQLFEDKSLFMNPKFGREEIAERLSTNRTYIANAIRTCTKENYTISEYINYRRVEYARYLLEFRQDISVKAVCEACGFNTRSNFYSVFRSIYGIAPGDFRRMILKQEKYK